MFKRKDTQLIVESWSNFLKESRKRVLLGNCINSFDEDGYCIQPGVRYIDTSDFAVGDENAKKISEEDFREAVAIPEEIDKIILARKLAYDKSGLDDYKVLYLYDENRGQYMLYDYHDDVHYFFG
jgi:hypothetical protein